MLLGVVEGFAAGLRLLMREATEEHWPGIALAAQNTWSGFPLVRHYRQRFKSRVICLTAGAPGGERRIIPPPKPSGAVGRAASAVETGQKWSIRSKKRCGTAVL